MHLLVSIALVGGAAFGTEWLINGWLGEARRYWIGLAGFGLLALGGALVQASGINEVMRRLRLAVIGAALRPIGKRLPWLGRRFGGREIGSAPRAQAITSPRWSGTSEWLLWLGWAGSLAGIGMIWTGVSAG